jgi:lipoate-protein ligase A
MHRRSALAVAAGPVSRTVRVLDAVGPAVVLGSSQSWTEVDEQAAQRAGAEIARRQSGGGAVLVAPGSVVWVDFVVPAGDPLWDSDVGRAAWWVGDIWAAALERVGVAPAQVWRGPLRSSEWSRRICFAGVGAGEVTVDGAKVVGVSQRRTRSAALFQSAALLRWDPVRLLDVLAIEARERGRARAELATAGFAIGEDRGGPVLDAVLDQLMP